MTLRALSRDRSGAGAAEFALVLPLFLLLLFGIIDAGRYMWEHNRAEKATQMGTRYAVVTDMVPSALATYSFALNDNVLAGNAVPTSSFNAAVCNATTCTCQGGGGSVCNSLGYDGTAFANIVERMQWMYPAITPADVEIEYRNVGLGYAGDPNGPDVAPLVTVHLKDMTFKPITLLLFGGDIEMPDFRAALTLEDGSGNYSN